MDEKENRNLWLVDPVHSKIRFETKYLVITSISGWFTQFEGTVSTPTDTFDGSQIDLTIYTNSVYTGNEERDNHLRSPDFFDAKKFPTLTFKSSSTSVSYSKVDIIGDICIKNITETLSFNATYVGCMRDPMGNLKAGFEMSFTINRKDFDITWNQILDQAGLLLSDEVKIYCDIQLLKVS